jgi:Ca-activated chloride channel family protein
VPNDRLRQPREPRAYHAYARVETPTRTAVALVLTCMSAVAAQEPAVFRASTDVVLVPVSVTDQNGRFVLGLTPDHFEISEGGTRRAVKQFSVDRVPVSLGILLDISGSITEDPKIRADERARWADMRRALALLVTRLVPADEVFFAVFNEGIAAASWTQDHSALLREFDALRPGGGNALLDAVPVIVPTFELGRYQRKVLLLITDGNDANALTPSVRPPYPTSDNAPPGHEPLMIMGDSRESVRQRRLSTTKSAVRRSDVTLYAIGIGRRKGEPVDTVLLEGLTTESGGYVEALRDPTEIPAAVARICDDLQSQYLLAFAPGQPDGKYHSIQVRTTDRRLRVRARAGYVALPASTK